MPVLIPTWRFLIVQPQNPFCDGRECTESRPSRNIESDGLLPGVLGQFRLPVLNEDFRDFNNHLTLPEDRFFKRDDFWSELQMDIEKLLAHFYLDATRRLLFHSKRAAQISVARAKTGADGLESS
jgi:hypothetical protein